VQDYKFTFGALIIFESLTGFSPTNVPEFNGEEKYMAMEREAYAMGILRARAYRSVVSKETEFVIVDTKFFPIGLN